MALDGKNTVLVADGGSGDPSIIAANNASQDGSGNDFWHAWSQAWLRGGQGLQDSAGVGSPGNVPDKIYEAIYGEDPYKYSPPPSASPFDSQNAEDVSQSVNDGLVYNKLKNMNTEEMLQYMIDNDPDNATSWIQALAGIRAERENLQDARSYEQYMNNTRVQRTVKDLEAAGINPILAYQYLSGNSASTGSAGVPSMSAGSDAASRANTKYAAQAQNRRAIVGIVTALIAAMLAFGKMVF